MNLDFATANSLIKNNPALRLLRSDHAPLVISFLHRMFIATGANDLFENELTEALEDELFVLEGRKDRRLYPRAARDYLMEWATPEKGWLRRFYKGGSNEPCYDITPAVAKVSAWLESLTTRSFVGTESRLLTMVDLLQQMRDGTEQDPARQLAEVDRKIAELQAQREQILNGQFRSLDATALKDRLQQFNHTHRDLVSDIREVQQNFHQLDRDLRQEITLWGGSKGELLDQIMGQRNIIDTSDQGRSFRSMWDFLLSARRQDELNTLFEYVQNIPELQAEIGDQNLSRMFKEWTTAAVQTQSIVAQLSKQLRRFLEDRAFLENRRIMETLQRIERNAIAVREHQPRSLGITVDHWRADIALTMDRRMFTPKAAHAFAQTQVTVASIVGTAEMTDILFESKSVDTEALRTHVRRKLQADDTTTLLDVVKEHPLTHGLAEVVAYLQLADGTFSVTIDDNAPETLQWASETAAGGPAHRLATLPRAIYSRNLT